MHADHGNVWSNHIFKKDEDAFSAPIDMKLGSEIHVFGEMNGTGTVRIQFSQDGHHWYNGPACDADEEGHFDIRESGIQARYVRVHAWDTNSFLLGQNGEVEDDDDDRMITATAIAKTIR